MSLQFLFMALGGGALAVGTIVATIAPRAARIASVLRGDELARIAPLAALSGMPERQQRVVFRARHETYRARWLVTHRQGAAVIARMLAKVAG